MNGLSHLEPDFSEFVEVDPTGRYGRYSEILGKGASKIVYRAFDEYEGIEVAWNQVKLYDFLQSPEDLERLYCEIHLLKTLKHKSIMKFYTSWVDTANRNINFVTEMFTSGTLRQYRQKHKKVNIRAVKHWCRQILNGLLYLHNHDPPVIHRDLKCDNIFINGNQGEVKIGDLGLAAILRKSHAAHCVGTPEFMAPEVYEEAYNELVDVYSFGMCILEMVTFEYPYSECTHPAQIYKKVVSGKKPDALYKVKDPEVRQFVEKCLATVSLRLSARELLDDPFLQIDDFESDLRLLDYGRELDERQPYLDLYRSNSAYSNGFSNAYCYDTLNEWGYEYHPAHTEPSGIELFEYQDDEHSKDLDISIKGKKKDDGSIFLRLRIADKEGRIRNIHFPFDIEMDTAFSVATEMVAELDITDQDVTNIADMIDGEISSLVPDWKPGPGILETPQNFCDNCASTRTSTGSLMEFLAHNTGIKDLNLLQCCRNGCASMHGRFEEITFQVDESKQIISDSGAPNAPNQSDYSHFQEMWSQHESRELTPIGSGHNSHSDEEDERENRILSIARNSIHHLTVSRSSSAVPSLYHDFSVNENEIQQELRWLKAKYQMELRKLRDQQQSGVVSKSSSSFDRGKKRIDEALASEEDQCCQASESPSAREEMMTSKSFFTGSLLPHSLKRTISLPVDAVDV